MSSKLEILRYKARYPFICLTVNKVQIYKFYDNIRISVHSSKAHSSRWLLSSASDYCDAVPLVQQLILANKSVF
jgi:hypothetical protein